MMNCSSTKTGRQGEELACSFLTDNGFEIIERNYRYGKTGEIDIVAMEGKTLVFIEVKYRATLDYGDPEFGITRSKISQVRKIAKAYMFDKNIFTIDCRFDVIAILELKKGFPVVNHYRDAF